MIVQPSGTAVPDPFFAAVRRRHPDVDLVILPPVEPESEAPPADPVEELVALASSEAAVGEVVRELWDLLTSSDPLVPLIRSSLRHTEPVGALRAQAEALTDCDEGEPRLLTLHQHLAAAGWNVRWPSGGLPRIVGTRDGLRLTASYAEQSGLLRLCVEGPACRVGREAARELTRPARRAGGRHRG